MSSIFDNDDNHDNLDRACLLHILNNVPSEHKYIYTQVWYDILKVYLHDKNTDIRFKSYIINKFTEVVPTWILNIFSYYANLFDQKILIKNIRRDNIQSILDNINSKLVCLEINPNEASNIIKWYGTWEAYWNDVFNQICYSILCSKDSIYAIQQLDKRDIMINATNYTIYEDNIKVIKPPENIIDIYNTYRDYIYLLLELNNKGMPN